MKTIKSLTLLTMLATASFGAVYNMDSGSVELPLKNKAGNVLTFPFVVQDAKVISATPEDFQAIPNKYSIVVVTSAEQQDTQSADLIVNSAEGYTFLIKLKATGKEQNFEFTTNKVHMDSSEASEFESGEIDEDIKKLIKLAALNKDIPGYRKVDVGRQFVTPDMLMQKQTILDGNKYRIEKWLLKNESKSTLTLDPAAFYTKGILALSFESPIIPVNKVVKMFLIVDKASVKTEE